MTAWSITAWLRRRLLLLLAGLWLAAAVIAALVVTWETNEVFDNALDAVADSVAALMPADPRSIPSGEARKLEQLALAGERGEYVTFQVRSSDGAVVLRSEKAPATPYPATTAAGFSDHGSNRYLTRPLGSEFIIQVAEAPEERREALLGILASFLVPLLVLLVAGSLLVARLALAVAEPITAIAAQVRQRGDRSLQPLDQTGVPSELQPVVGDINLLLGRLQQALEAERAFSANCAHELRNPIAAARAQADLIAMELPPGSDHARMRQLADALARLGTLIERLLQLSRADAGISRSGVSCDLVEVTRLLIDDYARRPGSAHRLDFDDGGLAALPVALDPDALAIAIRNLLDNAVAYGRPGSEIGIVIRPDASLCVTNDAVAVAPERLPLLVSRFERGGRVAADGAGLGLSIVEQIATQAGGSLRLTSPVPGRSDGFQAVLSLRPAAT